jgi:hypothetical protein
MPSRPRLDKISEAMKAWSAMLCGELATWPGVTTKPMFGFTAFYRKGAIFAVLPKTRGMGSPNSLAFKIPDAPPRVQKRIAADPRIQETVMQAAKWFVFEMESDEDVQPALRWLGEAYEVAKRRR